MTHLRERYLMPHVLESLKYSPLVGVLGQRQVGKTTLLRQIKGAEYVTLDNEQSLASAQLRAKSFVDNFDRLAIIDECQKAPALFSALKLKVQNHKRPGQFLLTGSIRFTSRKAIQESLTGRIINLELLPMSLAETRHQSPLDYSIFFNKDFKDVVKKIKTRQKHFPKSHVDRYMDSGGLPGICFSRETHHRNNKFKSHLETLLMRDIQLIIKTTAPYHSLYSLLQYLANNQGHLFSLKEASTYSNLASNTVKKILDAYENLFLIRRVRGMGFISGPKFYFEDQGMAHYLMNNKKAEDIDLNRFIFSQVFSNAHYNYSDNYEVGYFENKSGGRVDLMVKTPQHIFGFLYENAEAPSAQTLRLCDSFLRVYPDAGIFILSENNEAMKLDKNIIHLPKNWII